MTHITTTIKDFFDNDKASRENARTFFDWKLAAEIIHKNKPQIAYAVLGNNSYKIYENGKCCYPDELIASNFYEPKLKLNTGSKLISCGIKEYNKFYLTWTPEIMKIVNN